MRQTVRALAYGVRSQCRTPLLLLTLGPFVLGLVGAAVALWWSWAWLTQQIAHFLQADVPGLRTLLEWFATLGVPLQSVLSAVLALGFYIVVSLALAMTVIAGFAMPWVVRIVARESYPDLQAKRGGSVWASTWNALWVTSLMVLGWILCLPAYLFPPFAIAIPWAWWTFAFYRILSYDALAEHASAAERRVLMRTHRGQWIVLSGLLAGLNWLPFAWLALPVFSGIVFTHFGLHALRELRASGLAEQG